jgi:hypothetical protein
MTSQNAVDFADRLSRRRALGTALATAAFLAVQLAARPVFRTDGYGASGPRSYMWALNAGALLLMLLPAGGLIFGRRIRDLVNDEISRAHSRTASMTGFWVAMVSGLALYALPAARGLSAREACYVIVTLATGVALFTFAGLEARAHRHG